MIFRRPQLLKTSLTKTRQSFLTRLGALVTRSQIDEEFWAGVEETLIGADAGVETARALVEKLCARVEREKVRAPRAVEDLLKQELVGMLSDVSSPASGVQPFGSAQGNPPISTYHLPITVLVVGVNGSGKTTSIAKLARYYQAQGKKVLLAAADTFRAAAIEQLKVWGERVSVDVIAHQPESDPGAVAYDAWQAAKARGADVLIVDTAGRLQTKHNLMQELEKIARVLKKNDASAPHETLLVLDAVTGQNGLQQAREFKKTTPLTGLILTKLDGTAKGGIVFAIAKELGVPIRFVGTGETLEDFAEFDAREFVEGMFE